MNYKNVPILYFNFININDDNKINIYSLYDYNKYYYSSTDYKSTNDKLFDELNQLREKSN